MDKMDNNTSEESSSEFDRLQAKLMDLGFYEKGMSLDQMRQVMSAVDESLNDAPFSDMEIEMALKASERDFAPSAGICNSTMIDQVETNNLEEKMPLKQCKQSWQVFRSSPYSSPEVCTGQQITVEADVHHELEWAPKTPIIKRDKITPKRLFSYPLHNDSGIMLSSNNFYETTST